MVTMNHHGVNHMLALEPRFMYDGAAVATATAATADASASSDGASDSADADQQDATQQENAQDQGQNNTQDGDSDALISAAKELAFIDSSVEDAQTLIDGLADGVDVIELDADSDGVKTIAEELAQRSDIEAIHILSHGSSGEVSLGEAQLDADSLTQYSDELITWGNALTESGDILFYGCNIAEGDKGQAFIDKIAEATGADVAASTNDTGKGGDWVLEASAGYIDVDPSSLIGVEAQNAYQHVLATGDTANDAPTINMTDSEIAFEGSEIVVDSALTVSNASSGTVTVNGATVYIGYGFDSAGDVLGVSTSVDADSDGSFTVGSGETITYDYSSVTGVLEFEGDATAAEYQTILQGVTFSTTSTDNTDRTLVFSLGKDVVPFLGNGHYYQYVEASDIQWTEAKIEAEEWDLYGMTGYLATILSPEENDLIAGKLQADAWIGASDVDDEGIWRWVTGPEGEADSGNGTIFFDDDYQQNSDSENNGNAADPCAYSNWYGSEPNDAGSGEDYGEIYSTGGKDGTWNDYPDEVSGNDALVIGGYVVEYGDMSTDGSAASDYTLYDTITIAMNPVYAPALTMSTGSAEMAAGSSSVVLDSALTIKDTDVDGNQQSTQDAPINQAIVRIDSGFVSGEDTLTWNETTAAGYNITGNYDDATGVLTLTTNSGFTATAEHYQAVLRTVTYENTNTANPNETTRQIGFYLGDVPYAENGHYYEYMADPSGDSSNEWYWQEAKFAADARDLFGLYELPLGASYLATITSEGENAFITDRLGGTAGDTAWIGSSDNELENAAESDWEWVVGPEENTQFFDAATDTTTGYSNWEDGNPNAACNQDDYGEIITGSGEWSDRYSYEQQQPYVVEYDGAALNLIGTINVTFAEAQEERGLYAPLSTSSTSTTTTETQDIQTLKSSSVGEASVGDLDALGADSGFGAGFGLGAGAGSGNGYLFNFSSSGIFGDVGFGSASETLAPSFNHYQSQGAGGSSTYYVAFPLSVTFVQTADTSLGQSVDSTKPGSSDTSLGQSVDSTTLGLSDTSLGQSVDSTTLGPSDTSLGQSVDSTTLGLSDTSLGQSVDSTTLGPSDASLGQSVDSTTLGPSDTSLQQSADSTRLGPSDTSLQSSPDSTRLGPSDTSLQQSADSTRLGPSDTSLQQSADSMRLGPSDTSLQSSSDSTRLSPSDTSLQSSPDRGMGSEASDIVIRSSNERIISLDNIRFTPGESSFQRSTLAFSSVDPSISGDAMVTVEGLTAEGTKAQYTFKVTVKDGVVEKVEYIDPKQVKLTAEQESSGQTDQDAFQKGKNAAPEGQSDAEQVAAQVGEQSGSPTSFLHVNPSIDGSSLSQQLQQVTQGTFAARQGALLNALYSMATGTSLVVRST